MFQFQGFYANSEYELFAGLLHPQFNVPDAHSIMFSDAALVWC